LRWWVHGKSFLPQHMSTVWLTSQYFNVFMARWRARETAGPGGCPCRRHDNQPCLTCKCTL
jgi:hypothetical protein